MSLLGMPWVVINLGCEMIYILEQRLKAQNIAPDKAVKVIQDIVTTMFDPSFTKEKLFVPQEMYSLHSTRKIFDRLAHSSIMRLSESSMDKLFDLMVMGAKYQLLCSSKLDDMIQVMLRHLGSVQAILTSATAACSATGDVDSDMINLISEAEAAAVRFYGTLSIGEMALLRHTLARFFQEKRVKVSLFLSEGIQLPSGKLVMPNCVSDQVGLVRTYGADGKLESEEKLQLAAQKANVNEFYCHPVPLGENLYNKDRPKVLPPPRDSDTCKDKQQPVILSAAPVDAAGQQGKYADEEAPQSLHAAKELDFLAALVQVSKAPADNFKLNLFDDAADDSSSIFRMEPVAGEDKSQHKEMHFGTAGRNEGYIKTVQDVLEGVGMNEQPAAGSIGDDLLDLMDSVVC